METGLTLLDFANLPKEFWLESFYTIVYLINYMPIKMDSEIIINKTPYDLLFGIVPDYKHLHSFGFLCYPWIRPLSKNKLEDRSVKCIFLGYSMQYKGFKCYDFVHKKMFIPCHVKFYDNVFPFRN
jgi:hypothetical protein